MALGASSGRLIRQIVLEDALLVAGGSVCAFALGRSASGILVRWASNRNSLFTFDLHPNLPLAALGVGLMLLSLLCFSILPAVVFIRTGVAQTAGSRAKVAGISQTARQRLRSNLLLGTQVSLSLLLSTMSALFRRDAGALGDRGCGHGSRACADCAPGTASAKVHRS